MIVNPLQEFFVCYFPCCQPQNYSGKIISRCFYGYMIQFQRYQEN